MTGLIFLAGAAPEGGYAARALVADIFTEADDAENLREQVRRHFEEGRGPRLIRLRHVRDEVFAA